MPCGRFVSRFTSGVRTKVGPTYRYFRYRNRSGEGLRPRSKKEFGRFALLNFRRTSEQTYGLEQLVRREFVAIRENSMSDVFKKLSALKSEHGFVLVRATRHQIWKSREGIIWVCASTPSDYRVAGNQLTSLKRAIREGNQSEIIAISQFERDEADAILEGQKKQEANRAGAAGTRKKSQGVGIFYIETGRTLEEMTPEAREAHLKASQDAARRQQEREKLEREQRRSERILLKDFLGFMDAQIDAAEAEDIALFETTFAYEDRAVRAMRRKLLGKKLTLITMKSDETRGNWTGVGYSSDGGRVS